MSIAPSAASSAATPLASKVLRVVPPEIEAPLIRILPYITSGLKSTFNVLWRSLSFTVSLFRPILHLSPLPVLAYIFAPALVFLQLVGYIFFLSPYKTISYLLDALFPLYIFCGVACITGIVLGGLARLLCRLAVTMMQPDDVDPNPEMPPQQTVKSENNAQDPKGKGREGRKLAS